MQCWDPTIVAYVADLKKGGLPNVAKALKNGANDAEPINSAKLLLRVFSVLQMTLRFQTKMLQMLQCFRNVAEIILSASNM